MTPTFMAYLVGPLVRDYKSRYPNIHLEIFEFSMADIETGLADDSLDIAIAFDQVRNADIESIPAFIETLGLMVGRDHPLYDCKTPLTAEQVAQLEFALLTPDFVTRICIDEYFAKRADHAEGGDRGQLGQHTAGSHPAHGDRHHSSRADRYPGPRPAQARVDGQRASTRSGVTAA